MDLKQLKSGSDIRGTALDILGGQVNLTPEAVTALARGFARKFEIKKAAIGSDSRLSAQSLSQAAAEGLLQEGCDVHFYGLASTPAMFMSTVLDGCDGAIMLTASHHPKDKNGMKFFTKNGGLSSAQLSELIETASNLDENPPANAPMATYKEDDFLSLYCQHLQQFFVSNLGEMPLKGLKIAVDAGSGSAGFYATRILQPLGADISASQFLEPDGNFPFHAPNPEDKAAMQSISERVKSTKSDLGVIFDTDGDRSAIVTADGTEINRNRLIALISAIVLQENKGATIVTDSVTSEGLKVFIQDRGGKHIRYKRGYQNVISFAKTLCESGTNAPLAIETSGHAALKENYFLDDGAYLVAKLIVEAVRLSRKGKTLTSLIADLAEPKEDAEVRIKLAGEDWKTTANLILQRIGQLENRFRLADDSFEGVRVYTDDGWFMARMSVHDPVIPINIEADKAGGVRRISTIILEALKDIENADFAPIKKLL